MSTGSTQPSPPSPPESGKLGLEELAAKKLELEIGRLRRPWYRDVELLVKAFSVPLGIAGLAAGFYFSSLQVKVDKLEAEEKVLIQSVDSLAAQKKEIETNNAALESERLALQTKVTGLREQLADEAFRIRLDLATDASAKRKASQVPTGTWLPPPAAEMVALLRADAEHRPRNVSMLEKSLAKATDPMLKAELLAILWQGTRDPRWFNRIQNEFRAILDPELTPPTRDPLQLAFWISLMVSDLPTSARFSIGKMLIAGLVRNVDSGNPMPAQRQILVLRVAFGGLLPTNSDALDETTLDPFVDGIAVARHLAKDKDNRREDRISALYKLRDLSREALLVTVAEMLADDKTDDDMRDQLEEFEISFPRNAKVPQSSDAKAWDKWTDDNDAIVSIYSDRWLDGLREKLKKRR
jgi:hypothetical protein